MSLLRQIVFALARFLFWLTLFSFIFDVKGTLGLALNLAFIFAFLTIHVLPVSFGDRWDRWRGKNEVGLKLPPKVFWPTCILLVIAVLSRPWVWSLVSGFCYAPERFANGVAIQSLRSDSYILGALSFPLVEEFTFRGWLLTPLRQRYGAHIAVFITAVLFAIAHLRPPTLWPDLLLGILLGYTAIATNSIWPSVILHYSVNLSLFLLSKAPASAISTRWLACPESATIYWLSILAWAAVLVVTAKRVGSLPSRELKESAELS